MLELLSIICYFIFEAVRKVEPGAAKLHAKDRRCSGWPVASRTWNQWCGSQPSISQHLRCHAHRGHGELRW